MVGSILIDEMILNLQAGRRPIVPCTRRRTHIVGWVPLPSCPCLLQLTDKSFVSDIFFLERTLGWRTRVFYKVLFYKTTCVSKQCIFVCTETSTSIPLQCWPRAQKFVEFAKWPKYLRTETMLTGRTCRPNNLIEHMDQLSGEDSVSMKAWSGSQD